jgi:hypothetical protein
MPWSCPVADQPVSDTLHEKPMVSVIFIITQSHCVIVPGDPHPIDAIVSPRTSNHLVAIALYQDPVTCVMISLNVVDRYIRRAGRNSDSGFERVKPGIPNRDAGVTLDPESHGSNALGAANGSAVKINRYVVSADDKPIGGTRFYSGKIGACKCSAGGDAIATSTRHCTAAILRLSGRIESDNKEDRDTEPNEIAEMFARCGRLRCR